ncbi:putative chromosome-partitioning protein ParB [Andreesenia angusta]|uniref:Putative chromosome-partitioning protein ParB n=1 Tax=Andreesenia angusta TaxID=39480 RepID=A0A1S1V6J5_9FIRM|nr:ParB/RepB/Spo0J family partition protein [Andreesenia angusta]OHW61309.1 putative chromosome-partitioning protein ParB [Andreesenia angusta]
MKIEEIDLDLIEPNREQPRTSFNGDSLSELRDSIERNGIIQPIVLVKNGRTYRIVAGERRWRAAMGLKMKKIPAVVREISREEELEIAIVENIQRESLNPVEEALAFKKYLAETGKTQEDLSEILSKSRSYISNTIRLLKLPGDIVEHIKSGSLSSGHGRALLSAGDEERMKELCKRALEEELSVRELERLVSEEKCSSVKKVEKKRDIHVEEIERKLTERLGNKVRIKNGKHKGKIEIEYGRSEELDFLVDILSRQIEMS